jgi:peptide/nickel transport system substrate-binding protein
MENRFGVKDFVLFTLVGLLIVVVLLAMVQYDRQLTFLKQLSAEQSSQASDIASIRKTLSHSGRPTAFGSSAGTATTGPTDSGLSNNSPETAQAGSDPFARIKAAEEMPDYAPGDTIIEPAVNANKLTPLMNTDAFAGEVQDHVLESLITRDPVTLDWQPLLAEPGWKVIDNSQAYQAYLTTHPIQTNDDGSAVKDPNRPSPVSIVFKIRPNATFSDGVPVTVDDVVWTYDWIMNKDVEAPRQRAYFQKIRRVFKSGDNEVTFEFGEPYFDFLGLAGGMTILPKHFYSQYTPAQYNTQPGLLMGTGPYRMADPKSWTPGSPVELLRSEKYWGELPAIAKIRYRIIIEDQVRLTAFKNGELDQMPANPVQYKSLVANPQVTERCNHFDYDAAVAGYRFIAWNEIRDGKPTKFADKRVRQAMTMLVNRQRICDDILLGYSSVVTGPFSKSGKQTDQSIKPWPFDVDRAKAALVACGFHDDGSGSMKDADGNPFVFKLTYPSGSPLTDRVVLFMKDTMAKAGVTMEPDPLDWSSFEDKLKNHDFDAIMLGWTAGIEDDIFQMFDSHEIEKGGEDWMSYKNPELDQLIESARQTIDEKKRLELWRKCHGILNEDQPYTFMYTSKSLLFLDKRIHNVQKIPLGINDLTEWFVPKGMQKYQN